MSAPSSHPGAVETSGSWIPSTQAAHPPPHLTDLPAMPGCLPRSPGAGRHPWGPGTQFGWSPYSEGTRHRASCLFSILDTPACWVVEGVPGMWAGHSPVAAVCGRPASWTSLWVSQGCSCPRLLLKPHLTFQAYFRRHHFQEASLIPLIPRALF